MKSEDFIVNKLEKYYSGLTESLHKRIIIVQGLVYIVGLLQDPYRLNNMIKKLSSPHVLSEWEQLLIECIFTGETNESKNWA